MSDLPAKYYKMKVSRLNELALAGDHHALKALEMHQICDDMADQLEVLRRRVDALLRKHHE